MSDTESGHRPTIQDVDSDSDGGEGDAAQSTGPNVQVWLSLTQTNHQLNLLSAVLRCLALPGLAL